MSFNPQSISSCDIVPDPDSSTRRAVIEMVLGLRVGAAPSATRWLGNSVDNLLSGILKVPLAGLCQMPQNHYFQVLRAKMMQQELRMTL